MHRVAKPRGTTAKTCDARLVWLALIGAVFGCQGDTTSVHPSAGPTASEPEAAGTDAAASTDVAPGSEVSPGPGGADDCATCSPIDSGVAPPAALDCDASADCSAQDGALVVPPAVACALDSEPRNAPDCVGDEAGVFVDSRGNDANPGTKAAPVKTIGAALAKANGRLHVFVCRGIYPESVTLGSAVSLHGGFECESWKYSGGQGVTVMPEAPGKVALHVDGVQGALFSDVSFIAAPGTAQARSSVAAFVARSSGVVFRRVLLQAQHAADGAAGARGAAGKHDQNPEGLSSNSTTWGAPERICTCSSGGVTIGGAGGDGDGSASNDGANGAPATALSVPSGALGAGQSALQCAQGNSQHMHGSVGTSGSDALASGLVGYLDAEHGFVPADGAVGGPGLPGQGGGGGGGHSGNDPGGGGAGGCGGCGASGSLGGQGGGASLGLLVVDAEVRIEASFVSTAKAGNGGQGLEGARGGTGAGGGSGFGQGCSGGAGGDGGNGGASAGGAGGVSIGIAYRGAAPALDETTRANIKVGAAGAVGTGGVPGFNDGAPGISAPLSAL